MEGTASAKAYRSGRQWLLNVLSFLKKKKIKYLFIYWLCWVFAAARRTSLAAARVVFSLRWLLLFWSTGSRHWASVAVAQGLSCPETCGIFLDQRSNQCPLPCTADS